jgi:hypothetical protein
MSKMLPRIFPSSNGSTHQSRPKKPSKMGSASFSFQSLSGGIVKSDNYTVEFEDAHVAAHNRAKTGVDADADAVSAGSEEWIMMQDNPKDVAAQRARSIV